MSSIVAESKPSYHVRSLPSVSATDLKNSIADVFAKVASCGAVAISRHDKPRAVLLSVEEYEALKGPELPGLDALMEEYQQMFEDMQSPEQKAGALQLFQATPEELGAAAVQGALQGNTSPR